MWSASKCREASHGAGIEFKWWRTMGSGYSSDRNFRKIPAPGSNRHSVPYLWKPLAWTFRIFIGKSQDCIIYKTHDEFEALERYPLSQMVRRNLSDFISREMEAYVAHLSSNLSRFRNSPATVFSIYDENEVLVLGKPGNRGKSSVGLVLFLKIPFSAHVPPKTSNLFYSNVFYTE